MNLQNVVERIFSENQNRSEHGLQSDKNVQGHFTKSYKDRFFFELLQNARDAIVLAKEPNGKVKVWIENNVLFFANNGIDFDEKGVYGICYPAISDKKGLELIGHKGIGFNAVLEVTYCPEIVTKFGSFYFSCFETSRRTGKPLDKIPLFQFPHFREETIGDCFSGLKERGFTTVFKLPLSQHVPESEIRNQFSKISGQDLIFLEAIKELAIEDRILKIEKEANSIVLKDGVKSRHFKLYTHKIHFSETTIQRFDEDERSYFAKSSGADCRFLIETDNEEVFIPTENAPLFLFYKLDLESGFPFCIHSYFSVTLDRKRLIDKSFLNDELSEKISQYYANDFLEDVKRHFPGNELQILAYERKANANLEFLYKNISEKLVSKAFIYHQQSKRYVCPSEVLLVNEKIINLFTDGILGDKYLLVANGHIYTWLFNELKAPFIKGSHIIPYIEAKCIQNASNPYFFQQLYDLVADFNLDLQSKAVLLTEHNQLVSGSTTELYYQRKGNYSVPFELENSLAFLHKDIKVENLRDSSKRLLGLREYSEENLFRAALKFFEQNLPVIQQNHDNGVNIIRFLKSMNIVKEEYLLEISDRILLPVVNKLTQQKHWINPLTSPVYFPEYKFSREYSEDFNHIDIDLLSENGINESWAIFLGALNVWKDVPAAYIEVQSKIIANVSILNDRVFHIPKGKISEDFSRTIISNWFHYRQFIVSETKPSRAFRVNNQKVQDESKIFYSSIYQFFCNNKWVPANFKSETGLFQPMELIGMTTIEAAKNSNQIISQFIPVAVFDTYIHNTFVSDFNIIHPSSGKEKNYKMMLQLIHKYYQQLHDLDKGNFERFFNRILTFIHDYYQSVSEIERNALINMLREQQFLTKSIIDGSHAWTKGSLTIHIDDREFLDNLESSVLELISNAYSFTKRDRNEWGKLAAKIGRQLSNIIHTQIISTGNSRKLAESFETLEVIIGFVEDELERHLTDAEIQHLATADFYVHNNLEALVKIEDTTIKLPKFFHVDGVKQNTVVHIDSESETNVRIQSKWLQDFFERFTDAELKRFDIIIEAILKFESKKSKYKYAMNRNIDESRLEYIEGILRNGIGEVVEKAATEFVSARVISGGSITISTVVSEIPPQQQTEVRLKQDLDQYLVSLENAEVDNIQYFSADITSKNNVKWNSDLAERLGNGSSSYGIELNDSSRKLVGFLAEYYIYKKIIQHNRELLAHLGYDENSSNTVKWFNHHRVTDINLEDGSRGMGCDMTIEPAELFIEVKGMVKRSSIISITGPEFEKMCEHRDSYFLIIVCNLFEETERSTIVIKDPYLYISNGALRIADAKIYLPQNIIYNYGEIKEVALPG